MRNRYVYLAGPIAECTAGEANDWRAMATERLGLIGLTGVSPLRCEPAIEGRYSLQYADPMFGTARAISSKNIFDVKNCDMTFAYLPREINERRPSYGTIMEIAWTYWAGKPVIVVTDDDYVAGHPLVNVAASWIFDEFDPAFEVMEGVLGVYL